MTDKVKSYNNESISALKGPDRVRKRPSVIFGSDGLEGCQHTVFEILSNSIDEAREGSGKVIEVTRHKDSSITVKDYGRGMPVDYNTKEKRYNWELVFCELYAGAKYGNNEGESYMFSLGLNGLGCCATQYAAEYMDVEVFRDGYQYNLHFEEGVNKGGLKKKKSDYKKTGTAIRWKPDIKVFTEIDIPLEYFKDMMKKQAIVNKGLKLVLFDEESREKFEYFYKDGVEEYIREITNGYKLTEIHTANLNTKGQDRADKPEYKLKLSVSFCFCNEVNLIEYYHNSSFLEHGGSPDRAVRTAFTYAVDKLLTDEKKYNKNENKINFSDIQDSLVLVSNSFSTITSYENQTKKAITNKFIKDAMTDFLKHELEIYFIENKPEALRIIEQILVNKRSRETAEKTRLSIKKQLSKKVDVTNRVKKFVDCRSKKIEEREIYIVEGDSALGSVKLGRDAEFQAIMPVRGKILNCLKADYNSIFKNEIITDLIKVLGCGVEIKTKHNKNLSTFDINDLNWNKVIICTDADVDGFQIRTLILAMLYRLVPTLINEGKVFIAESPLFEITAGGETYFAYNEVQKNEILKDLEEKDIKRITIQRSKGLGENEPDMMWKTTMNPETRKLIQVLPTDAAEMEEKFNLLLGDNLAGRKEYIQENSYKYLEMADVS
ncbi:MAG TPA: toprim domain-containing protein [Clostridia bacterium]|nr:toprim domain-containing protein [Clostridia bacterium]HRX41136.1 toprim domain-containing protein [Clostridia bacterium]